MAARCSCLLALLALAALVRALPTETTKVTAMLGPGGSSVDTTDGDEGLSTVFDARGGHQTTEGLRQCYDTVRRCPASRPALRPAPAAR
jgi:hypothetical protein